MIGRLRRIGCLQSTVHSLPHLFARPPCNSRLHFRGAASAAADLGKGEGRRERPIPGNGCVRGGRDAAVRDGWSRRGVERELALVGTCTVPSVSARLLRGPASDGGP
jgi:hypothetical protein